VNTVGAMQHASKQFHICIMKKSFDSRKFLIESFFSYHFEKITGYSLNFK